MEKEKSDKLITDSAKIIFSYCRARTNSKEEAEDLSQDIIIELLRAQENLRDDKAFYGFMWAVAGNVYKDRCKKRRKISECELDGRISDDSVPLPELLEKETDLRLLYRELGFLTEQYRYVTIQYYFNKCKISDISKSLNISESMVKFLLFKSRKILKEGMDMERTRGDLSFAPGNISIAFLGNPETNKPGDARSFLELVNDNLIAQNILLACYNDRCKAEEISLQIGVAVPYLEKDLQKLCEKELLIQKGGKYETAIVILTKEYSDESYEKTLSIQHEIAEMIAKFLNERLNDIKAVGFYKGVEDNNLLKWLMTYIICRDSANIYLDNLNNPKLQKKYSGIDATIFGKEPWHSPNNSGVLNNLQLNNANGDEISCMDFTASGGESTCFYLNRYQNRVNILLDIAKGKSDEFSENDMSEIAEFIKLGYIEKNGGKVSLKLPIFTKEQQKKIEILIDDVIPAIADKMREVVRISTDILVQHTPVSLKKETENICWSKVRDCFTVPAKIMLDNGALQRVAENAHPAAFVVLA